MMLTSTQIGELAAQFFIAGAGTLSFAVLFGCPRKSLPFCGLVGAVLRPAVARQFRRWRKRRGTRQERSDRR